MDPHQDDFWSKEPLNWADEVEEYIEKSLNTQSIDESSRPSQQSFLGSHIWDTLGSITNHISGLLSGWGINNGKEEEISVDGLTEASMAGSQKPVTRPSILDLIPSDVFRNEDLILAKEQDGSAKHPNESSMMRSESLISPSVMHQCGLNLSLSLSLDPLDHLENTVVINAQNEFNELIESLHHGAESTAPPEIVAYANVNMHEYTEADYAEMEYLKTQQLIQTENEYQWREIREQIDPEIHHWNWLGNPVYQGTTTPPADSLAFMQAVPKSPAGRDKHRINAIINNAMELIDPVVVKIDRGSEALLGMHGSQLIRACEGRVFNLYTPNGRWIHDEDDEVIMSDIGGSFSMSNSGYAVGNGIFGDALISRNDWRQWRMEIKAENHEFGGRPRRMNWRKPGPSKLRHFEIIGSDEGDIFSPRRMPA